MSRTSFRVNSHSIVCLNVKELLARSRHHIWSLSDTNKIQTHNHLVSKRTPFSQTGQMIELCCVYLSGRCIWLYVIIMSHTNFRVNPHSIVFLNVKELLARSRHQIWSLTDNNKIWTHSHLSRKWTLNHLAKLAKWLSCIVSAYLYGAFELCYYSLWNSYVT